ncbi:MAG TPA: sigma-70 family RNA polymerase sigma factor [Pyrinomonadaceae bacterium]|nr:sigma-70 family RNA polymerase sigma factor [Pyrinomonadaceae bacterium]
MVRETAAMTEEKFNALLGWLDGNREAAGQKYEKIRQRLIRIFAGRGCFEAEELADETINRVMQKLPRLIDDYAGEPALYFYGVANNIYLEWLRKQKKNKTLPLTEMDNYRGGKSSENELESTGIEYDCLEACLESLSESQRRLIVEYYREEKQARIKSRQRLAEKLEISASALQVKTHRIRARLHACLKNCLAQKKL